MQGKVTPWAVMIIVCWIWWFHSKWTMPRHMKAADAPRYTVELCRVDILVSVYSLVDRFPDDRSHGKDTWSKCIPCVFNHCGWHDISEPSTDELCVCRILLTTFCFCSSSNWCFNLTLWASIQWWSFHVIDMLSSLTVGLKFITMKMAMELARHKDKGRYVLHLLSHGQVCFVIPRLQFLMDLHQHLTHLNEWLCQLT